MEKSITLSKRLSAIASFIPDGAFVADVGTDHGYIPVWLAQEGKAIGIVASDLREGPLDSARRTALEYGVSDKIEFVLTNGLVGIEKFDIDNAVIAGMGGETIINILSDSSWVLERARLILQPQSKIPELLKWLNDSGISVENSRLVEDDNRIYVVITTKVGFDSDRNTFGYIPGKLISNKDPLLYKYLTLLSEKLRKTVKGLQTSDKGMYEKEIEKLIKDIAELEKLKAEAEKWQQ